MTKPFLAALFCLPLLASAASSADAVFQYVIPINTTKKQTSQAFVWLPPNAKQIRGVVMAGMTLGEREMVRDPLIRETCADAGLAIVFLKTGLGSVDLQRVLDDLAAESGASELAGAPLLFFGHSAGGPQAKAAARQFADRCFGIVQFRGGNPGEPDPVPPGIPALMMLGQFDEFGKEMMRDEAGKENWEYGRDSLATFRAADPANLGSLVVEPGAGHFAWSDRSALALALFIQKAALARIPDGLIDNKTPVKCKIIDPSAGWVSDLTIKSPLKHEPTPASKFAGDRGFTAWHFDREIANATALSHQELTGKKDQFVRWKDGVSVDAGARFFFNQLDWSDDGQSFITHPAYAETYPKQFNGLGPRWPLAGQPVGQSKAPIAVRHVGGPIVATGPDRFRIRFDALNPADDFGRGTFLAFSPGDKEFRYAEQVGMMPRGFTSLTSGKDQAIDFAALGELKPGQPLALKAQSDANLPVEFYVASGPAVIEDGQLRVAELPARAQGPIEVKVVAWQFGRAVEPKVKTAKPVERTVLIQR
jgi:hypothetical protein